MAITVTKAIDIVFSNRNCNVRAITNIHVNPIIKGLCPKAVANAIEISHQLHLLEFVQVLLNKNGIQTVEQRR